MRVLVTVPWAQTLGGAEAMLQAVLTGAREEGHEVEPVFFEQGEWAQELRAEGFRVEVIEAGRLREAHRWLRSVLEIRNLIRDRRPDVILNWAAKTQLYGAPAAILAGRRDSIVWWQQAIPPPNGWLDRAATLLPATAIFCYSRASATAQARLFPARRTHVIAAGAPIPEPTEQRAARGARASRRRPDRRSRRSPAAVEGAGPPASCPGAAARSRRATCTL